MTTLRRLWPAPRAGARTVRATSAPPRLPARGFTLVEAVLGVVVLAICGSTLSSAIVTAMRRSGDNVEITQLAIISQQFLDEISLKQFDPAANPSITPAPNACSRAAFNDVSDYNGYSQSSICDLRGNTVAELSGYSVSVSVVAGSLNGAGTAKQITVSVVGPSRNLTVSTWRVKPT